MKYFIFFICVANLIVGLSCLVMYFTDVGYYGYNSIYLMNSSAGFVFFYLPHITYGRTTSLNETNDLTRV